jgi:hypothetical protein
MIEATIEAFPVQPRCVLPNRVPVLVNDRWDMAEAENVGMVAQIVDRRAQRLGDSAKVITTSVASTFLGLCMFILSYAG